VNTHINLGSNQQTKLSEILSRHLSRSPQGKQIISKFRQDERQGREALIDYLDHRLPEDEALTTRIAETLGGRYRNLFTTIVAEGGSVGDIININQLDELTIKYYVFSDVRQVLTVLLSLVVIAMVVFIGVWWSRQPRKMTGDFNIAVAEFVQTGDENSIAPVVSQRIASFLDGQYKLSSFEDVQVAHNKIGVITSAEEASELARKINAHLVIYGDVTTIGDQVLVTPQFYVVELHQNDVGEVNGEQRLAARIRFFVEDLLDPSNEELEIMQQSATILIDFTKALVYLAAGTNGDLELAHQSIDSALEESKRYGSFDGKEALYLFASDIARRRARLDEAREFLDETLRLNENYGRGYIAKANIYYDEENLFKAYETYEFARNLPDQPFGAYIAEKASLGIGNVCLVQFQYAKREQSGDQAGVGEAANCALENYQWLINSFQEKKNPETNLTEMAAWAFYGMGIVYQESEQPDFARQALDQAMRLTDDPELKGRVAVRLNHLNQ
jgi:tetratricopeptide (TPR) repeat protein